MKEIDLGRILYQYSNTDEPLNQNALAAMREAVELALDTVTDDIQNYYDSNGSIVPIGIFNVIRKIKSRIK